MNVELRSEARDDLVDAAVFYHIQKDGLGDHFIKCIYDDLKLLESQAGIHESVYGLHRKLSKRFPYAIYYNVTAM